MSKADKRANKRYHVALEMKVVRNEQPSTALMMNLSLGGVLAEGTFDTPLSVGERMEVSFRLPDMVRPLTATAEVRWFNDDDSGHFGLQFMTEFRPEQTWALSRFLERQTPI